jgi:hypothetical protein
MDATGAIHATPFPHAESNSCQSDAITVAHQGDAMITFDRRESKSGAPVEPQPPCTPKTLGQGPYRPYTCPLFIPHRWPSSKTSMATARLSKGTLGALAALPDPRHHFVASPTSPHLRRRKGKRREGGACHQSRPSHRS